MVFPIRCLQSAICDFIVCYALYSGSKAWRYGHVKSFLFGRGALQDRASVGQMPSMENK